MGVSANVVAADWEHDGATDEAYAARVHSGKPELVGPDPDDSSLLQIRLPLEPLAPDLAWCQIFNEMPPGLPYTLIFHPPEAGSTAITGKAHDEELEDYVAHIVDRIAATNEHYNMTVAPQLELEAEQRESERQLEERRLEEARKKLDNF